MTYFGIDEEVFASEGEWATRRTRVVTNRADAQLLEGVTNESLIFVAGGRVDVMVAHS